MTNVSEIEGKIKTLGLNCNNDTIVAYCGRVENLIFTIKHFNQEMHSIKNDVCLSSDILILTRVMVEYIAVMTIGLTDILSCLLNDAFLLPGKGNIYLSTIIKELQTYKGGQITLAQGICDKIKEILDMGEWDYMHALDNYAKHNGIVKSIPILYHDEKKGDIFKYCVDEFIYKNKKYSTKSIDEFIDISDALVIKINSIIQYIMEYK